MSRLTVIGSESSGKTVFTASVADFFSVVNKTHSCCLLPDDSGTHDFVERTNRQLRLRREWPEPTPADRPQRLRWTVRIDGAEVSRLEMIEFGGQVFRDAFKDDPAPKDPQSPVGWLFDELAKSDFIVIAISLKELTRELKAPSGDDRGNSAESSEIRWLTNKALDFVCYQLPKGTGVAIALTGADAYREELKAHGGPEELFAKCWPSVAALYPDVPVLSVSSVSQTEESGRPAADFANDGILPVMKTFADHCTGGTERLTDELESILDRLLDPIAVVSAQEYRKLTQDFEDRIARFRLLSGLSGDDYCSVLRDYVDSLVGMKDEIAANQKRLDEEDARKWKEEAVRRQAAEEAERARHAEEERLKAEEDAAREEAARKCAEDERIRAEKELERQKFAAEVEVARAKVSRIQAAVAALFCLTLVVCAGLFMAGNYQREKSLRSQIRLQDDLRRAKDEQIQQDLRNRENDERLLRERREASEAAERAARAKREADAAEARLLAERRKALEAETAALAERRKAAKTRLENAHLLAELSQSALAGNLVAANSLIRLVEDKVADAEDVPELYRIYTMLALAGNTNALIKLAEACLDGSYGAPRSLGKARKFLLLARERGLKSPRLDELLELTAEAEAEEPTDE